MNCFLHLGFLQTLGSSIIPLFILLSSGLLKEQLECCVSGRSASNIQQHLGHSRTTLVISGLLGSSIIVFALSSIGRLWLVNTIVPLLTMPQPTSLLVNPQSTHLRKVNAPVVPSDPTAIAQVSLSVFPHFSQIACTIGLVRSFPFSRSMTAISPP